MPFQSSLSTRFYERHIVSTDGADITGDTVQWAFMPWGGARPASADFHTADYTGAGNIWQLLIGPDNSGLALTVGSYGVWEKVADDPEIFAELVDVLVIT